MDFQAHREHNFVVLLVLVVQTCYAFGMVGVICELCQRITNKFNEFDDILSQFDWYMYPHQIQKMLLMLIMSTQQEIVFECFGKLSCDRESFKRVSWTVDKFYYFIRNWNELWLIFLNKFIHCRLSIAHTHISRWFAKFSIEFAILQHLIHFQSHYKIKFTIFIFKLEICITWAHATKAKKMWPKKSHFL